MGTWITHLTGQEKGYGAPALAQTFADVVELLARHGEEEGAILSRYQRFAGEASAPETRYLVKLILRGRATASQPPG